MLKHLRNKSTQKKIYIVLACLIIPSFVILGVFTQGDKATSGPVGTIDGKKISLQDYLSSYRAVTHQAQFMYGERFNEVKKRLNFRNEAWDRLLLVQHARNEKLKVSDSEVVNWITGQPLFTASGRFDDVFYKRYVQNYLDMRERDFEEEIRQMLLLIKVRDRVKASTSTGETEVRDAYDRRFGEKSLVYGLLPWEAYKDKVQVPDSSIEQIYPVVKDRLTEPDKIKLRYVTVPREKAEAIKNSTAGMKMEAVAAAAGVSVQETPSFSKNDVLPEGFPASPELLSAAFALKPGEEGGWVDLEKASYKISVAEKTPGRTLTLEEAKQSIRLLLARQEASQEAMKRLQGLKPRLEKEDFEKVLKEEKIEVRTLERYKAGDALPGFGESEQVWRTLADLKAGQVSDAFQGPAGAAIVKITKDNPADGKAYEAEKQNFRESLEDEKTDDAMRKLVERLRKNLKIDAALMRKIFGEDAAAATPAAR